MQALIMNVIKAIVELVVAIIANKSGKQGK